MDETSARYQRDVNCIGDNDRSTRTRALKKLDGALFGKRKDEAFEAAGARSVFFKTTLLKPLLERVQDPVEKNRELALTMVRKLLEEDAAGSAKSAELLLQDDLLDGLTVQVVEAVEPRVSEVPFPETSEEIRLLMMEVLTMLLDHPKTRDAMEREFSKVVKIVSKTALDSFPDNKKQSAQCCIKLCELFPEMIHLHFETLLVPNLSNMNHQHAKVRQACLEAIKMLIMCCARESASFDEIMMEKILPVIRTINHDRASAVRIQNTHLVSDLLLNMPNSELYRKDLLPIILFGLADTAKQIQELTLDTIEKVGEKLNQGAMDEDGNIVTDDLPEPFSTRPGPGARKLVVDSLPATLPVLLQELTGWTVLERHRAVALVRCMLVYAESAVNPFTEQVLRTLYNACIDDESDIRDIAMDCARLLGKYVNTNKLLEILIQDCLGKTRPGNMEEAPSLRLGALTVLSGAILGFSGTNLNENCAKIAEMLSSPSLADSDNGIVNVKVLHVIQSILDRYVSEVENNQAKFDMQSTTAPLLKVLLLLITSGNELVTSEADDALVGLSICGNYFDDQNEEPSPRAMIQDCSKTLLLEILGGRVDTSSCASWTKFTPERRIFDQIVRRVGVAGLEKEGQLKLVIMVLLATAPVERDADLRLTMLSLLETMIASEHETGTNYLDQYMQEIVNNVLMPNLVWRAGQVASTIRKVSMFCFSHLIGTSETQAKWFLGEMERLQPMLKSCLDDMDTDTRRFACISCKRIYGLYATNKLELQRMQFSDIYHDVIKRLDDADDKVRLASCAAMKELIRCSPVDIIKGTACDYITDVCFIHMDDQNEQVKQATYEVVATLVECKVDNALVLKKAETHRARHRSPTLCDALIASINN